MLFSNVKKQNSTTEPTQQWLCISTNTCIPVQLAVHTSIFRNLLLIGVVNFYSTSSVIISLISLELRSDGGDGGGSCLCLSSTCLFVYLFILESQKDKIKMIIKFRSTGALLSTSSSQQKYFKDYYQVYLLHALVICDMHFRMVIQQYLTTVWISAIQHCMKQWSKPLKQMKANMK